MTKPWVMDGRKRASRIYRCTHVRLALEILRARTAIVPAKARSRASGIAPVQMSLFEPSAEQAGGQP